MKILPTLGLMFVFCLHFGLCAASSDAERAERFAEDDFKLVPYQPIAAFIPQGFDENDTLQIILAVQFSNARYRLGKAIVDVDKSKKIVWIKYYAKVPKKAEMGADVFSPELKVVVEFELPKGTKFPSTFKVMLSGDQAHEDMEVGSLPIAVKKTDAPDDYPYAPITNVRKLKLNDGGDTQIAISGKFTNSCMQLEKEHLRVFLSPNNVIEILPVMPEIKGDCAQIYQEFERIFDVRELLLEKNEAQKKEKAETPDLVFPSGLTLIHVRSMNKRAENLITFFE